MQLFVFLLCLVCVSTTPTQTPPTPSPTNIAYSALINLDFTNLYSSDFAANTHLDLALRETTVYYSGFAKNLTASDIATPVSIKDYSGTGCTVTMILSVAHTTIFKTSNPSTTISTHLSNSSQIPHNTALPSAFISTFSSKVKAASGGSTSINFGIVVLSSSVGVIIQNTNLSPSPVAAPQAGTLSPTAAFVIKGNGGVVGGLLIGEIAGVVLAVLVVICAITVASCHFYNKYYGHESLSQQDVHVGGGGAGGEEGGGELSSNPIFGDVVKRDHIPSKLMEQELSSAHTNEASADASSSSSSSSASASPSPPPPPPPKPTAAKEEEPVQVIVTDAAHASSN